MAIIAADQCVPACLPAMDGECIRIIRTEDGSLADTMYALADTVGSSRLVQGTVILLGSVSHLAKVGTAQYLTDWVRSRWWLRNCLGVDILILPLSPIPVSGIQGSSLIRSLLEAATWFTTLSDTESALMKVTHQHFIASNLAKIEERKWADSRQILRVPAGLDTKATVSLVSEGWGSIPVCIPPLSIAAKTEAVVLLVKHLNDSLALSLDTKPCMERSSSAIERVRKGAGDTIKCAVVGGSHAGRLTAALGDLGVEVTNFTVPGWKVSKSSFEVALNELSGENFDYVILWCLENSVYFCFRRTARCHSR